MRRIIAVVGILMAGAGGCKHVCGKCDCSAAPGEATLYAPFYGYQAPPVTAGAPIAPVAPGIMPSKPAESIGAPKPLPQ